jgi:hypothetical protein
MMRQLRLYLLAAVACGAITLAQPTRAEIIITEIMYNADGSDDGVEWVEIYNTGTSTVDLEGWRLFDEDAGSQPGSPMPAGAQLAPKQALVLIEDQTRFEATWGTGINLYVYPGMGTLLNMANAGTAVGDEVVQLANALGIVVDAVDYSSSAPFPVVTDSDETSIYLLPSRLSSTLNDLGENWGRSTSGIDGAYAALDGGSESASPGYVASIPEPATSVALALGTLSLVAGFRRRRANR